MRDKDPQHIREGQTEAASDLCPLERDREQISVFLTLTASANAYSRSGDTLHVSSLSRRKDLESGWTPRFSDLCLSLPLRFYRRGQSQRLIPTDANFV